VFVDLISITGEADSIVSSFVGLAVPIPTLPVLSIVILSFVPIALASDILKLPEVSPPIEKVLPVLVNCI